MALDRLSLPTGTVTFVFTDIEGSTARWETAHDAMSAAVRRHDALLREIFTAHGGYVFKTVGDAFCVAFADPVAALAATLEMQRRIALEDFTAVGGMRIRVGIHTGAADERDGDYFGPTVNRVARLNSSGHGGQVLLSRITAELVRDAPLGEFSLLDLGEYRLKDLAAPERIFQASTADLPATFPPLRTADFQRSNLPAALTPLIGREREFEAARAALESHRLVTFVGTGGLGKTSLALAVASSLQPEYPDGVWFVDLSALPVPALVADTFAAVLGVRASSHAALIEAIVAALRDTRTLLVVDNCEHVIDEAAARVADILARCPQTTILATSREGLRVRGERLFPIAPLAVPERDASRAAEALEHPSVALLVERASAAGRFELTDANAAAVTQICRRLDGIPFALELAAPRLAILSPQQLLARLAEPLRVLRNERRGVDGRTLTLRAMIEWSYRLLDDDERALFRRLAPFAGTFSIDHAVAIANDDMLSDALDVVASLVAKSLVITAGEHEGEPRFRLFESTRAFALEQATAENEREAIEARFIAVMRDEANARAQVLYELGERRWLDAVERDLDNLRAALELAFGRAPDVVAGAELTTSLAFYWHNRRPQEGKHWLRLAREHAAFLPPALEALVFLESARVDVASKELREFTQRAVDGYRAAGDAAGVARALEIHGQSLINLGAYDDASAALEESVALAGGTRAAASARGRSLRGIALLFGGGDPEAAAKDLESALPDLERGGRSRDASMTLRGLGLLAGMSGRYDEALTYHARALVMCESLNDPRGMALLYNEIALWHLRLGHDAEARANVLESLRLARDAEIPLGLHAAVLAGTLALERRPRSAAKALGFIESPSGGAFPIMWRQIEHHLAATIAELRARIGDAAFDEAYREGRSLAPADLPHLFEEEIAADEASASQ